ncbi:hypothetical protein TcWFU_004030 [Taenia crassiceps]|uniref:Uncharacterized protein n=1 Tax=Taenia crassiceps TaxID=6207 RepID=A0ABR4Q9D9_9CEST
MCKLVTDLVLAVRGTRFKSIHVRARRPFTVRLLCKYTRCEQSRKQKPSIAQLGESEGYEIVALKSLENYTTPLSSHSKGKVC